VGASDGRFLIPDGRSSVGFFHCDGHGGVGVSGAMLDGGDGQCTGCRTAVDDDDTLGRPSRLAGSAV